MPAKEILKEVSVADKTRPRAMSREDFILSQIQLQVDVLDDWDVVPCDCEFLEFCPGWKLVSKKEEEK